LGHALSVEPFNSRFVRVSWIFSETAWRHMNCRQAAHVFAPSFLGFQTIRLAAESDPLGDVFIVAVFLVLVDLSVAW